MVVLLQDVGVQDRASQDLTRVDWPCGLQTAMPVARPQFAHIPTWQLHP
jgi:hypothetical protein